MKAAVGLETEIKYGKRVLTAMASHLNKDEQPVLFVAHRGNFRAFAKNYGRVMDARNAELYRFKPDMSHPDFPWKIWKVTLNQGKITETPVELKRDLPFSGRPDTSNTQQR